MLSTNCIINQNLQYAQKYEGDYQETTLFNPFPLESLSSINMRLLDICQVFPHIQKPSEL